MYKIAICLYLLLSQIISFGQCDNTLKPSDNTQVSYKTRGNKCEGEYSAKVSAPSLEVVGFTIGIFSYKFEKTEAIEIVNSTGSDINIRSSAIPIKTYYRMDASLKNGQALKWDIEDVLIALQIHSNYLGVFGWTESGIEKTYIPVKPVSSNYDKTNTNIYLVVRADKDVLSAKYRYAKTGQPLGVRTKDNLSIRMGKTIIIKLPPELKGAYKVELAALLDSNSGWKTSLYTISVL